MTEITPLTNDKQTLIDAIDVNQVGQAELIALSTVKSLNRKIKASIANPIWESSQLNGTIAIQSSGPNGDESAMLLLDEPHEYAPSKEVRVKGDLEQYRDWDGMPVIVNGYIKSEGTIEDITIRERRLNTLELVIMSQCPFGIQAAEGILPNLMAQSGSSESESPIMEIRYLFYQKEMASDDPERWWCLHGEPELHENLVQMVIRDVYPDYFGRYLHARIEDESTAWDVLAGSVGLTSSEIEGIAHEIETNRAVLIESEHAYVSGELGVTDGSPTWVWESEVVLDPSAVDAIADISTASAGKCGDSH